LIARTSGIVDRLAQEANDRLERLEGLVHEKRAAPDPVEHRLRPLQCRRRRGLERREAQRRRVGEVDQLVHPHQVDRAVDPIERELGEAELLEQELRELGRAGVDDLEPDRLAEVAARQARSQRLAQVGDVGVDLEVGVARDAELRERLDLAAGKERAEVGADDAGQEDERLAIPAARGRQLDHPRQDPRHLDDRRRVAAAEGVPAGEAGDEVERFVGDLRERMRRVETDRHQQRPHLGLEEGADPALLGGVAVGVVEDADAAFGERRHHLVVEDGVLLVEERVRRRGERLDVGRRRAAVGPPRRLEAIGEADLEELVEVRRDDVRHRSRFEQGHIVTTRLGEEHGLKLEHRAFAVSQGGHRHGGRGDGEVIPSV
jgi:hypothetical protein